MTMQQTFYQPTTPYTPQNADPFTNQGIPNQAIITVPAQLRDSSKEQYPCRYCNHVSVGSATLALHLALRHNRTSYANWVQKTFEAVLNTRLLPKYGNPDATQFTNPCPIPECTALVGPGPEFVDLHIMYSHAHDPNPQPYIQAYGRQRDTFEQVYAEVRGWTNRNQNQPNGNYAALQQANAMAQQQLPA